VSCWPISRPHGPVRLHTLQPRVVSKRVRTDTLPLLLTRHVLRNVCVDSSDWPVPSRFLLCSRSNFCHLHSVCPRFISANNGPARVHTLQPRSLLHWLGPDCRDGQLPSRIVFSCRCYLCHLHAVSCRQHEREHWTGSVQPVQPRRLLHVHRFVCSEWFLPNGNLLSRRSIVGNVHPVRPWKVLRQLRAWICVWLMSNWFIFYRWRCHSCVHRLPHWYSAKQYWTVCMFAMLCWYVLRITGPQRCNWALPGRIVLVGRCHGSHLHQVQRQHFSTCHRASIVLTL